MVNAAQYQAVITESRVVTLKRTLTCLATSAKDATRHASEQAAHDWRKVGERHGITVGADADQLMTLMQRLAYPEAGQALLLEDFRNIARNILENK